MPCSGNDDPIAVVCLGRDWHFWRISPLQQRPAHQRDLVRKVCSQWSCRLGSSGLASDHSTGANSNLRRMQFFQSEKEERSRAFKRLDACEFAIPSEQKKNPQKVSDQATFSYAITHASTQLGPPPPQSSTVSTNRQEQTFPTHLREFASKKGLAKPLGTSR